MEIPLKASHRAIRFIAAIAGWMDVLVGVAMGIVSIQHGLDWIPVSFMTILAGLYALSASGRLFKLPWLSLGLITSALFHGTLIFTVSYPPKPTLINVRSITIAMVYLLTAQLPTGAMGRIENAD